MIFKGLVSVRLVERALIYGSCLAIWEFGWRVECPTVDRTWVNGTLAKSAPVNRPFVDHSLADHSSVDLTGNGCPNHCGAQSAVLSGFSRTIPARMVWRL